MSECVPGLSPPDVTSLHQPHAAAQAPSYFCCYDKTQGLKAMYGRASLSWHIFPEEESIIVVWAWQQGVRAEAERYQVQPGAASRAGEVGVWARLLTPSTPPQGVVSRAGC